MNFEIEVQNLGRNWEAKIGSVATMDLEKFHGFEQKFFVLESDRSECYSPQCNKFL